MSVPDLFGFLSATEPKALTAPAGYETVHQPGFSWARQGVSYEDTSRVLPDHFNQIIGNLRGVAIATPGFDPAGRDARDPLILRDAITAFSTQKIIDLLPGTVLAQASTLGSALAGNSGFVAACVAAVPANLNATNLTSGTVGDDRYVTRLGKYISNSPVMDWHSVYASGLFYSAPSAGSNAPDTTSTWLGEAKVYSNNTAVIEVWKLDNLQHTSIRYRKARYLGGGWSGWKVAMDTELALDANYAQLAGAAFTGAISAKGTITVRAATAGADSTLQIDDDTGVVKAKLVYSYAGDALYIFEATNSATALTHSKADGKWRIAGFEAHHDGRANKSPSYTVGTLPSAAAAGAGAQVYCSNARVLQAGGAQQGAGAGTGSLVISNGTAWQVAGTNMTAAA